MKIHEITDFLEEIAPLHYQESYDNSGLLVGDFNFPRILRQCYDTQLSVSGCM